MSKKTITLIDTYNNEGLTYADYVEECEMNEITPADEKSQEYYYWLSETVQSYTEDFFTNLRYMHDNETPVIVSGTLGLWDGVRQIYPVVFESTDYEQRSNGKWAYKNPALLNAIEKCISGMDDFKVELVEGEIIVHGYHHDGTNTFIINKISKKGMDPIMRAKEEGKHLTIKNYWVAKFRETDLW
jgi:hypothetical protein